MPEYIYTALFLLCGVLALIGASWAKGLRGRQWRRYVGFGFLAATAATLVDSTAWKLVVLALGAILQIIGWLKYCLPPYPVRTLSEAEWQGPRSGREEVL